MLCDPRESPICTKGLKTEHMNTHTYIYMCICMYIYRIDIYIYIYIYVHMNMCIYRISNRGGAIPHTPVAEDNVLGQLEVPADIGPVAAVSAGHDCNH